jgi:high-affinity nickel-transport protein
MTTVEDRPKLRHRVRSSFSPVEWRHLFAMFGFIVFLHALGFGLLFLAISRHYHLGEHATFGVGLGVLAYTLGLRHAFDADHIAAIDNTTRKFMNEGKRPMSTGFFFSLGHSTIVFVMTLLLGIGIKALGGQARNSHSPLHEFGNLFGTLVSGSFLYMIAILNLIVLIGIFKLFLEMRRGRYDDAEMEKHLNARGFMMRFFGKLTRSIDVPWKMYPVGVLFGLGFDTATEVLFLVLAGTVVAQGLPLWALLSLPILFAAGMCLLDTIDGSFMNFAYGWAFSKPLRKVYYNITITGLSVFVALFIGTVELLQVLKMEFHPSGTLWNVVDNFNINTAGFIIVGMFVVVWVGALSFWRFGRVEDRWESAAIRAQVSRGERPDLHSAGITLGAVHQPFTIDN